MTEGVQLSSRPGEVREINLLLKRITENFKDLESSGADVVGLKSDMEDLPKRLDSLTEDLRNRVHYCEAISRKLISETSRREIFTALSTNKKFSDGMERSLIETKRRVKQTERILETLFKLGSYRRLLGYVPEVSSRKAMSKAMMKTSITLEKIFQARKELNQLLESLEERGLCEQLDIQEIFADECLLEEAELARRPPAPPTPAPRPAAAPTPVPRPATAPTPVPRPATAPTPKSRDATGERPPGAARATQDPAGASRAGEKKRTRNERHGVSEEDLKRMRRAVNRLCRWNPLIPWRMGNAMRIVAGRAERAVEIQMEAQWGERRQARVAAPYRDNAVDSRKISSLWDLPAAPPDGPGTLEESQPVPGEQRVRQCDTCGGKGRSVCKNCQGTGKVKGKPCRCESSRTCTSCQGVGKLFEYQLCETRYFSRRLQELDYSGELPSHLIAPEEAEKSHSEEFTARNGRGVEAGLENTCSRAVARWVQPDFLRNVVEKFLYSGDSPGADDDREAPSRRLIRVRVKIFSVPVRCVEFALRAGVSSRRLLRFRVWVHGKSRHIQVGNLPRTWTGKAWLLTAALVALAAPAGYALAQILAGGL